MKSTINYIEDFGQTSRTILFERFTKENPDGTAAADLCMLLGGRSARDALLNEVEEKLGVRSFEEFVDKFTPFIYEEIWTNQETGEIQVTYKTEKPEDWDEEKNPVAINAQAFYRMIERIYDNKKNSGQTNGTFDFDDISRLLCPKERHEEYKRLRKQLSYYTNEYYRLEELTPGVDSVEKDTCIDMIEEARITVSSYYQAGVSEIIPIQLADAQTTLLEMSRQIPQEDCEEPGKMVKGFLQFDDKGNIQVIPDNRENETEGIEMKDSPEVLLLETLEEDFKEMAPPALTNSKEITDLVLSTISNVYTRRGMDLEEAKKKVDQCQKLYKQWNEALAEAIAPLIEKFLGVRAFFENTHRSQLKSQLIVANCTAAEVIKSGCGAKLGEFLELLGSTKKQKIWFGIIPGISLGDETVKTIRSDRRNPFGKLDGAARREERQKGLTTSGYARELMEICEKAQVMCFYNYKANENTCFGNMTKATFEKMRDNISFAGTGGKGGSYAVCCLPNFTVLPKSKAKVIINQELKDKNLADKLVAVELPGIYIDAAYVACGMVVGCQNIQVLEEKGFLVDRGIPGIRVDFEEREVSYGFLSNMCRESLLPCPRDLEEEIMGSRFGFYFDDREITDYSGRRLAHCYVRNARTMRAENGKYWKLNNVLFAEFIRLCISGGQNHVEPERIQDFIQKDVNIWKKHRQDQEQEEKKEVNRLLREDEKIERADDSTIEIEYREDKDQVKVKIEEK